MESRTSSIKITAVAIIVLLMAVGGFVGGIQYQKTKTGGSTASAANGQFGNQAGANGFGGRGGRMNAGFGTVSAVSASSITVQDERQNTTKIYTISSSTTFSNSGTSATASDVKVGDTVVIRTASSTSSVATQILINPTMGGGPGSMTNSEDTQTSSGTST